METEESDEGEKLRNARKLFEEAVDHHRESHAEAHRAARFYHNTRLEGQWESEDLAYLRDEGRPAFSFNIIKDKVDSFLGIYSDAQRSPMVMGTGAEDQLMAEVIDMVKEQVLQDAKWERKSAAMLKTGTISGECGMHVEVKPSNEGPGWVEINLDRIMPFELHWDAASIEADRSDARHVFWDRWLSKAEFQQEYPDHKDDWAELSRSGEPGDFGEDGHWGEDSTDSYGDRLDDYDGDTVSRYYFDRQKRKARVIRYEFKTFVDKVFVTHLEAGNRTEADGEQLKRVEQAIAMGAPYKVEEVTEEVVKVIEFIGPEILAEYDSPGPFKGFSIVPYTYAIDEEEGTAYGLCRNLFDPQMEMNKAKSLEVEYIAQSVAPGVIAEVDAPVDENQFMAELRRPGGAAMVKKNQLDRVMLREASAPSLAVTQRAMGASELVDRISGIPSSGNQVPASQAEAATTVALRYHKSRQIVQSPIANFEDAQDGVVRRVVDAIVRAMPDDQIQQIIANDSRYQVGQGMVVEMAPNPEQPDGPMVPKARASLRNLRSLNWNIELEHSTENSTLRMMELETQMSLIQAGVPVDPEIMVELSTGSRSRRERLKAYVEQAQRSQAEASEREAQQFQMQMDKASQLEMAKAQEDARHNRVEESLKAIKQHGDMAHKFAALWEKADEFEKQQIAEMLEKQQIMDTANQARSSEVAA